MDKNMDIIVTNKSQSISNLNKDVASASSIKVICRFRPFNKKEQEMKYNDEESNFVSFTSDTSLNFKSVSERSANDFNFDRIFPMLTTQKEVYEFSAKDIVDAVLDGYNGTVFAYGQTSSGKTFSMTGILGDSVLEGIIPRMIQHVFYSIMNTPDRAFTIKVSMIEIYMEQIRDLLDIKKSNLNVRETKDKEIYIQDLSEHYVYNEKEVLDKITIGNNNRTIAYTNMNANSSRSHSLVIVTIQQENKAEFLNKTGKLYLVDLAGSEKATKTGAVGKVLDEAKMINKSLTTLGMVINALTDGKSTHVPYRESKLTRVLTESLGGNAKTCLIITCSPSPFNESETLSTLRFGARAKNIKNKPKMNKEVTVDELKVQIAQLEKVMEMSNIKIEKLEEFIKQKGFSIEDALVKKVKTKEEVKETPEINQNTKPKELILTEDMEQLINENDLLKNEVLQLKTENNIFDNLNSELKETIVELNSKLSFFKQKINETELEEDNLKRKESNLMNQIEKLKKTLEEKEKYLLTKDGDLLGLDEFYQKMKKYIKMLDHEDKSNENDKQVMNKMIINIVKSITKEMKQAAISSSLFDKTNYNLICEEINLEVSSMSDILNKNSITCSPQPNESIFASSSKTDSSISNPEKLEEMNSDLKSQFIRKIANYKSRIAQLEKEKADLISKLDLNFEANEKVIISKMYQQDERIHYLSSISHQITTQNSSLNIKIKMLEQKIKYSSSKISIQKKENEELRRLIRMKDETISYYEKSLCFDNMKKVIHGGTTIPKKVTYSSISEETSTICNSHTPVKAFDLNDSDK